MQNAWARLLRQGSSSTIEQSNAFELVYEYDYGRRISPVRLAGNMDEYSVVGRLGYKIQHLLLGAIVKARFHHNEERASVKRCLHFRDSRQDGTFQHQKYFGTYALSAVEHSSFENWSKGVRYYNLVWKKGWGGLRFQRSNSDRSNSRIPCHHVSRQGTGIIEGGQGAFEH